MTSINVGAAFAESSFGAIELVSHDDVHFGSHLCVTSLTCKRGGFYHSTYVFQLRFLEIMDTNRQDALVELESELRVNLSLVGIIPLLEKTQDGRGGFMTREEKISVVAEKGDPNRVSKIIEILRKKDNDAFDRFREILKRSGNEVWEKTIREYVERATVRRAEKHLGGFEGTKCN